MPGGQQPGWSPWIGAWPGPARRPPGPLPRPGHAGPPASARTAARRERVAIGPGVALDQCPAPGHRRLPRVQASTAPAGGGRQGAVYLRRTATVARRRTPPAGSCHHDPSQSRDPVPAPRPGPARPRCPGPSGAEPGRAPRPPLNPSARRDHHARADRPLALPVRRLHRPARRYLADQPATPAPRPARPLDAIIVISLRPATPTPGAGPRLPAGSRGFRRASWPGRARPG